MFIISKTDFSTKVTTQETPLEHFKPYIIDQLKVTRPGVVVMWALPSLHGGSLVISLSGSNKVFPWCNMAIFLFLFLLSSKYFYSEVNCSTFFVW